MYFPVRFQNYFWVNRFHCHLISCRRDQLYNFEVSVRAEQDAASTHMTLTTTTTHTTTTRYLRHHYHVSSRPATRPHTSSPGHHPTPTSARQAVDECFPASLPLMLQLSPHIARIHARSMTPTHRLSSPTAFRAGTHLATMSKAQEAKYETESDLEKNLRGVCCSSPTRPPTPACSLTPHTTRCRVVCPSNRPPSH